MTEAQEIHTRLLRVSLAVDDAHVYWRHARPGTPAPELAEQAFEERWFGSKRMPRILMLLRTFAERFDAYPPALEVLHRWCPDDPATRRAVCHWHTQLTDPLYRRFTSELLPPRWARRDPTIDRDVIARWLDRLTAGHWAPSTNLRIADGLLAAATEAGLCAPGSGQRLLKTPRVTDDALTYLLYLLREVDREGGVLESPYLVSIGLGGTLLEQHLRRLEALDYRRHGDLHDFGWHYDSLPDEEGSDVRRAAFLEEHPERAKAIRAAEAKRRERKRKKQEKAAAKEAARKQGPGVHGPLLGRV